MTTPQFMAVILAGGRGTRMEPFSKHYPKPLLPVLGRPVIVHQIEQMRAVGVRDVVVVVGHLGTVIRDALGDGAALGVQIRYVEQGESLGIAHALGKAEPLVDRPFFLTLGDIYFATRGDTGLEPMLQARNAARLDGVLAARDEPDEAAIQRNFVVTLDGDGLVRRVIEKPSHPATSLKGCGVYLFNPPIFDAIRRTPRTTLRDEYELTDAIQISIDDGRRIGIADVVDWDVNVTFPKDLWLVNRGALARFGQCCFVAEQAQIGAGANVDGSVIGAGAIVGSGVQVLNCVVFPGTTVDVDASNSVLTPEARLMFTDGVA